jgi:hypothetical protein
LVPERRLSGVRHLDPLLVGRRACDVAVVPVPPLVGWGLRTAFGRVLPDLLPAKRRDVEVVPGATSSTTAATSRWGAPKNITTKVVRPYRCTRTRRSRVPSRLSVACCLCQSWANHTSNISERSRYADQKSRSVSIRSAFALNNLQVQRGGPDCAGDPMQAPA